MLPVSVSDQPHLDRRFSSFCDTIFLVVSKHEQRYSFNLQSTIIERSKSYVQCEQQQQQQQ